MQISEPWRIQLLGRLRAQQADRTVTRFSTQKTGALLAYLAFYREKAHPREVLIELLWPEAESSGRASLSVALSSLRHQLEPPGVPAGTVIQADRLSVGLNPAAITTDVAQFEQALKAAKKATNSTEQAQLLQQALDLYGGSLLPDVGEDWILGERERLAGLYFDVVSRLITLLEETGDLSDALEYARQAISMDPLREEAHQSLMRLLAAAGQPGAALRQYKELEHLLDEQLDEEPSASLRALARQIEKDSGLSGPLPVPLPRAPVRREPPSAEESRLPVTLTFLLTDIAGSARLWERAGEAFRGVLESHHRLLRAQFAQHGGREVKEAGNSFLVAFPSAQSALACAVASQQALAGGTWPDAVGPLRVRMALHTGDVTIQEGEYHGPVLHRAARMLVAAHGGQILLSEATAALVQRDLPEAVRLIDLGIYRLRDVPTPERLFQVEHPGIAQKEFPPLAAEKGHAAHLPLQFTRFFGREEEMSRLSEMLLSSEVRLVTITGLGGTGKTRLALEVAARLVEPFSGAVWFVELAELREANLIAEMVLDTLSVPRLPDREPLDQVVEALSKQPSLLVLDNFEHLLGGASSGASGGASATALVEEGADLVQALLARVPPHLTCLITSRQLLSLAGEREFALLPLPTPNGTHSPERLCVYESVQLFIDRAQAVRPDFQVTNATAPAIAELCDRLEGIPLAIELAAARAQVLTPYQMLSQLGKRFDFLVSRRRGVAERQRTLRSTIEWSFRLLTPELQRFLARLSVFRGGWTIKAVEDVCDEPLALDYLAQLRECSLVLSEESASGEMRFRLLETLREFAREKLTDQGRVAVQQRHQDWFLHLAEEARPKLKGPEQAMWMERLEIEHDNLRAAQERCKNPDGAEAGLRLAGALCTFWCLRGHWKEGREWFEDALKQDMAFEHTAYRAAALNGAGVLAAQQREFAAAREFLDASLVISRELEDKQSREHDEVSRRLCLITVIF